MNFHFYTLKFCKSARYYQTQEVNPKLDRHFPRLLEQDTISFELKKDYRIPGNFENKKCKPSISKRGRIFVLLQEQHKIFQKNWYGTLPSLENVLISKCPSDLKQNGTKVKKTFFCPVLQALSNGVIPLMLALKKHSNRSF